MSDEGQLLIDRDRYLKHGVHIGTKNQHDDMDEYIFHVKKNQLAVLDLDITDVKIREVAEFLSGFDLGEILVVGRNEAAKQPIEAFTEELGTRSIVGRFMPGTLTNPESDNFIEPEVVIISDPEEDAQAINEAEDVNIPVVAIADSGDKLDGIDYVIPANNKAVNSLGMVYYLLADQIQEQNGRKIEANLSDFRPEIQEETEE